jgi:hypothetical protein
MSENPPIRAGFAIVNRNPLIAAIEIAWRWTFGLIGTVLLLLGTRAFLAGLKVSEGDEQVLHGQDPTLIAAALMHVLQQSGVLQRFFGIMAAVAIPSALVWIAAATLGRAATLRRLMPTSDVNVKAILGLTLARAGLLLAAVIAWYVWMLLCAILTITPDQPNYPLYLLLSMLALPVIAIVWGVLNWILSLAPVIAVRDGSRAWKAYSDTVGVVRRHRGEFTSVSTRLGLPRLAAMLIALMVTVVVLVATSPMVIGGVALTLITLVYCAFADYLYIVRLAAYAQIARELPIATAATPL